MKEHEAREALWVALEGGPWPRGELIDLVAAAIDCHPSVVKDAARGLEITTIRRAYWVRSENLEAARGFYVEGFPRERLIRHLVCRQEPRATASERLREDNLDEWDDLMGAESVYEDPNANR